MRVDDGVGDDLRVVMNVGDADDRAAGLDGGEDEQQLQRQLLAQHREDAA